MTDLIRNGLKDAWPIIAGYLPIGLACGLLSARAGMTWWQIALVSATVYGGSAQFMAASLLLSGAEFLEVFLIIILLNSRHILLTSSLSTYVRTDNLGKLASLGMLTSDENYALNVVRFKEAQAGKGHWSIDQALTLAALTYLSWLIFTVLGAFIGQWVMLPDVVTNFVLIALFIALLVPELKNRETIKVATLSLLLSVVLMIIFHHSLVIIVASLLSLALVFYQDHYRNRHDKGGWS